MRSLDIQLDLSLADLVLTKHPKSEATFAHRLEIILSGFECVFIFMCQVLFVCVCDM